MCNTSMGKIILFSITLFVIGSITCSLSFATDEPVVISYENDSDENVQVVYETETDDDVQVTYENETDDTAQATYESETEDDIQVSYENDKGDEPPVSYENKTPFHDDDSPSIKEDDIIIIYNPSKDRDTPDIKKQVKSRAQANESIESLTAESVDTHPQSDSGIEGLIEYESFVTIEKDQTISDAEKKGELRGEITYRKGNDSLHLYSRSDMYLYVPFNGEKNYHYSRGAKLYRSFRYASQEVELSFRELYVNIGNETFRLRVGNQIYGWGTGDAFNPTSCFNPSDMRELFFKDDDELKQGVPSISGMYFGSNFTVEAVFVPVHSPGRISTETDFWSLTLDNYDIPIVLDEPTALDTTGSNFGFGTRLTTTMGSADMSVSMYHGPDKDAIYRATQTILADNSSVSVLVEPYYGIISQFGADCSFTYDTFVFQLEATYSSDKTGVKTQDNTTVSDVQFPYSLKKGDFISVSTGFNYFIPLDSLFESHEGDTVFTAEYFYANYISNDISKPFLSQIALFRLQDSYFKSHLNLSVTGILDLNNNGRLFWPKIEYDFLNGYTAELSASFINGNAGSDNETESIFYYLRENDFISLKVRYEF